MGVIESVITDEAGNVIDGHHRVKACGELGVEYPEKVIEGLSEEQKQDLSLKLNMHRRHLTKEQKKELATDLSSKGWGYKRIAKVTGTAASTIQGWLKSKGYEFVPQENSDNLTPAQNLEAIIAERLQTERAESERRYADEKARLEQALREEMQSVLTENERLREEVQTQRDEAFFDEICEKTPPPGVEEKLDKALKTLAAERKSHEETLGALLRQIKEANEKLAEHEREKQAAGGGAEALEERRNARGELERLKRDIKEEKENSKIRKKLETLYTTGIYQVPQLAYLIKEKISKSGDFCGLTLEELSDLKTNLVSVSSSTYEASLAVDECLEEAKKKGGLQLVQ
jgi:ParB-like chromosome segregation protein Spo0J